MLKCALCLNISALKNSHIIPEFVYKPIYDEKHRCHFISVNPRDSDRLLQKGLREPLLCADCEQKFSKWERYTSLMFSGGNPVSVSRVGELLKVEQIDAASFRLFQLSILWRASISKNVFFRHVSLGAHEEKIRLMLLNEDPKPWDYAVCMMFGLQSKEFSPAGIIVQPNRGHADGHTSYRFIFSGFGWMYFVSSHSPSETLKASCLDSNGNMPILLTNFEAIEWMQRFALRRSLLE